MTPEEKELLVKDLCERLPYGVKICVGGYICMLFDINTEMGDKLNGETFHTVGFNKPDGNYDFCAMTEVKPYLRPMSSMTKEEFKEYHSMLIDVDNSGLMNQGLITKIVDWLDRNMFDHRNLIPKGLALEASEDMYKIESL